MTGTVYLQIQAAGSTGSVHSDGQIFIWKSDRTEQFPINHSQIQTREL